MGIISTDGILTIRIDAQQAQGATGDLETLFTRLAAVPGAPAREAFPISADIVRSVLEHVGYHHLGCTRTGDGATLHDAYTEHALPGMQETLDWLAEHCDDTAPHPVSSTAACPEGDAITTLAIIAGLVRIERNLDGMLDTLTETG